MGNYLHLAGDIGGTKTLLALFSREKGPLQPLYEKSYASSSYPGLDAIIFRGGRTSQGWQSRYYKSALAA
jgi:glucokinase